MGSRWTTENHWNCGFDFEIDGVIGEVLPVLMVRDEAIPQSFIIGRRWINQPGIRSVTENGQIWFWRTVNFLKELPQAADTDLIREGIQIVKDQFLFPKTAQFVNVNSSFGSAEILVANYGDKDLKLKSGRQLIKYVESIKKTSSFKARMGTST